VTTKAAGPAAEPQLIIFSESARTIRTMLPASRPLSAALFQDRRATEYERGIQPHRGKRQAEQTKRSHQRRSTWLGEGKAYGGKSVSTSAPAAAPSAPQLAHRTVTAGEVLRDEVDAGSGFGQRLVGCGRPSPNVSSSCPHDTYDSVGILSGPQNLVRQQRPPNATGGPVHDNHDLPRSVAARCGLRLPGFP
jgi:hypothetical protein